MASRRINCLRCDDAHYLPGAHAWMIAVGSAFLALAVGIVNGDSPDRNFSLDPAPGKFFVANQGDDQWSGTLPRPNARRNDGPFATLPRALQAVRDLRQHSATATNGHPVIMVREGMYLPFGSTDSDSCGFGTRDRIRSRREPGIERGTADQQMEGGRREWKAPVGGGRAGSA